MYLTVPIRLTILAVTSRSTVERFHMIRLTEIEGEILVAASGDVAYQEFRSHFSSSSCTQFCPKLPGLAHATTCFATRRDDSTLSSASSRFCYGELAKSLKTDGSTIVYGIQSGQFPAISPKDHLSWQRSRRFTRSWAPPLLLSRQALLSTRISPIRVTFL